MEMEDMVITRIRYSAGKSINVDNFVQRLGSGDLGLLVGLEASRPTYWRGKLHFARECTVMKDFHHRGFEVADIEEAEKKQEAIMQSMHKEAMEAEAEALQCPHFFNCS
jgi:hypothetical protein